MTRRGRQFSIVPQGLFVLLAILNCWFAWQWVRSRRTLRLAVEQYQESLSLAHRIELLQREPVIAGEAARSSESINRICETAAKAAGIESEQVIEIAPRAPRRLENSSYQEQVTHLELRQLTLRQLFEFVGKLRSLDKGLHIHEVSLREPIGADTAIDVEFWNIQMALTTYIYTPKLPSET